MSQTQPDGYLAVPSTHQDKGVLVLHPWWGLNDTIKAFCDRLAEAGFVAFAPDLYHGKVTDQISEADRLSGEVFINITPTQEDVKQAAYFLNDYVGGNEGLAVIGFSFGAFFALDLSMMTPELVRSVVVFYGACPGDYSHSKAAYLGHFAESDIFEPQEGIDSLQEALQLAGRPVTFYQYEGTGHWFFEPDRVDAYHESAANLAWERTLEFLTLTFAV